LVEARAVEREPRRGRDASSSCGARWWVVVAVILIVISLE
jgi:hypothetical protein